MKSVIIRELQLSDETNFIDAMQRSKAFYDQWMATPALTNEQFIGSVDNSFVPFKKWGIESK